MNEASRLKYFLVFILAQIVSSIVGALMALVSVAVLVQYDRSGIATSLGAMFVASVSAYITWAWIYGRFKGVFFERTKKWFIWLNTVFGSLAAAGQFTKSNGAEQIDGAIPLSILLICVLASAIVPRHFETKGRVPRMEIDLGFEIPSEASQNIQAASETHEVMPDIPSERAKPVEPPESLKPASQVVVPDHKRALIALEYRPELRDILNRAGTVSQECKMQIMGLLEADPKLSTNHIESMILAADRAANAPYDDDILNAAWQDLKPYGPQALREFAGIVDTLGNTINVDFVLQRIKDKFYSNNISMHLLSLTNGLYSTETGLMFFKLGNGRFRVSADSNIKSLNIVGREYADYQSFVSAVQPQHVALVYSVRDARGWIRNFAEITPGRWLACGSGITYKSLEEAFDSMGIVYKGDVKEFLMKGIL